jgi:flagellar basal-body rod modification protein FlgD
MSISSIQNAVATGTANQAMSQLSQDYDKFITLLVAQVQYQDPLKPIDSTEFVSQIAQLTQVEQAVATNGQLESLRAEMSVSGALYESTLVGREVTAPTDQLSLADGKAAFAYELTDDSTGISAVITDSEGNVVREISGLSGKGDVLHDVTWDGMTNAGVPAPAGAYNLVLSSESQTGSYTTYTSSEVLSVDYVAGEKFLRLQNGNMVLSGDIVRAS